MRALGPAGMASSLTLESFKGLNPGFSLQVDRAGCTFTGCACQAGWRSVCTSCEASLSNCKFPWDQAFLQAQPPHGIMAYTAL